MFQPWYSGICPQESGLVKMCVSWHGLLNYKRKKQNPTPHTFAQTIIQVPLRIYPINKGIPLTKRLIPNETEPNFSLKVRRLKFES